MAHLGPGTTLFGRSEAKFASPEADIESAFSIWQFTDARSQQIRFRLPHDALSSLLSIALECSRHCRGNSEGERTSDALGIRSLTRERS
jgi:hypothetical protein